MFGFFKEIKDLRRRVELLEGEHLSDEARSYYQQKYEKSRKRNYAKAKKLVMEKGIKLYSDVFRKYRSSGDLCLSKKFDSYYASLGDFCFSSEDAKKLWDFSEEIEEAKSMRKLLIPLKLPFLAVRELLILVLKYCYGCTVIIPKDKDKMGYERYWQR